MEVIQMNKKLLVIGLLSLGIMHEQAKPCVLYNSIKPCVLYDLIMLENLMARINADKAQACCHAAYSEAFKHLNFAETSKLIQKHGIYKSGQSLEEFKKTNNETSLAFKFLSTLGVSSLAGLYCMLFGPLIETDICSNILPSQCQELRIMIEAGAFWVVFISGLAWSLAAYIRNNADYDMYQKMEREGTLPAHYDEVANILLKSRQLFARNNYY
jgi:hypothetical protein